MQKLESRKRELDALIAGPDLYEESRKEECRRVLAEHGDLLKRLGEIEEEWLGVQEELEAIDQGLPAPAER